MLRRKGHAPRCDFASKLGAHVLGLWVNANATEIEPVGIPASADGRVLAQLAMRMPGAGVVEKFEMRFAQVKQDSSKGRSIGCTACTVCVIPAVMFPPGIMENGE
jgi:hypothetical protein